MNRAKRTATLHAAEKRDVGNDCEWGHLSHVLNELCCAFEYPLFWNVVCFV